LGHHAIIPSTWRVCETSQGDRRGRAGHYSTIGRPEPSVGTSGHLVSSPLVPRRRDDALPRHVVASPPHQVKAGQGDQAADNLRGRLGRMAPCSAGGREQWGTSPIRATLPGDGHSPPVDSMVERIWAARIPSANVFDFSVEEFGFAPVSHPRGNCEAGCSLLAPTAQ
jgi:hypothetical protein